jgi:hypothetical protein
MSQVPLSSLLGPQRSYVQTPRFDIIVNGTKISKPLSAEISSNNYSESSTFKVSFLLTPAGDKSLTEAPPLDVEVRVSLDSGQPVSLIYGFADTADFDPLSHHWTLAGRDLSALLVDTQIAKTYENMTSSQVVQSFVEEHVTQQLKGSITPTSGLVGRFYGSDHSQSKQGELHRPTTEWAMALMLAQGEGFDLRMGGPDAQGNLLDQKTLYFGPPPPVGAPIFNVIINQGPPVQANVERITIRRALTLAKDVQVNVIGWNSEESRRIVVRRKASNIKAPKGGFGPAQNYTFRLPGDATLEQATTFAEQKLKEITAFERVVTFTMPGGTRLNPSNMIQLNGSGTDADQLYFIDQITRTLDFQTGFTMSVRMKNHSPYNIVAVD